jgi:UTP--glucose-1-phosphate uridylyltransferase
LTERRQPTFITSPREDDATRIEERFEAKARHQGLPPLLPPVTKAIIPAAGLGTRLLSATKELPKEMLSVFSADVNGGITLKPVVQLIFEQLFDMGVREFYFVVGRGKRAIEDHFTPDTSFVALLKTNGKEVQAREMQRFYDCVSQSTITWVNQPEPRGFGDAVLRARSAVGDEPFLVHAGDNHVMSAGHDYLKRMLRAKASAGADATLLLRHVPDPRRYGVAEVSRASGGLIVNRVVEKPSRPASKLALLPVYVFEPVLFDMLRRTKLGVGGELQLTDAIQGMIEAGLKVNAAKIQAGEYWLDVGTPETYWKALSSSHRKFSEK